MRRADLDAAKAALAGAGFVPRRVASVRDALHVIFAGEKIHERNAQPAPDVSESEEADAFRLIALDALVRMKLTAFRDKDRTHLRDLLELGLIDETWLDRVPPELRSRLEELIRHPEG